MQGGIKHYDFRRISRFISEMMQDSAIVTNLLWKANRKQHPIFPMAPISMTLSDPAPLKLRPYGAIQIRLLLLLLLSLTHISRSRYYSTSNNSKTLQDRAMVTMADQ